MKIKSKLNWFMFFISLFLLSGGIFFLIIIFKEDIPKTEKFPSDALFVHWLLSILCIAITLVQILLLKTVVITDSEIIIQFLVRGGTFKYSFEDLAGYDEKTGYDIGGKYQSFLFTTRKNNVYMISSREYGNYSKLTAIIAEKCPRIKISPLQNLILVLKVLSITALLSLLAIWISCNFTW